MPFSQELLIVVKSYKTDTNFTSFVPNIMGVHLLRYLNIRYRIKSFHKFLRLVVKEERGMTKTKKPLSNMCEINSKQAITVMLVMIMTMSLI